MKLRISSETVNASANPITPGSKIGKITLINQHILEEDESIVEANGQKILGSNTSIFEVDDQDGGDQAESQDEQSLYQTKQSRATFQNVSSKANDRRSMNKRVNNLMH